MKESDLMNKKHLSTGKKLLVALFLSCSLIFLGIMLGFFIKTSYLSIFNHSKEDMMYDFIISLGFTIIAAIPFSIFSLILLRDYESKKNKKTKKWYIDKICVILVPVWITASAVVMSFNGEDAIYSAIGFIMFVLIGIIVTPNVIGYAIKDMKNWEIILKSNGNLHKGKPIKDFYKVGSKVPFEKKLYLSVIKIQLLDIWAVITFLLFFVILGLFSITHESSYSGGILSAVIHVKAQRADGYLFFILLFIASFWIPILAYYITNTVYKLRVVRKHKYIAYHATIKNVDGYVIHINDNGKFFKYNYCTCVGIKAKNVNNTKATLVFIPDEVLLFPDKEDNT